MKKRDLSLLILWLILVVIAIAFCFKVYVMDKNYQFLTFTSCDETSETCFAIVCDSKSKEYPVELCRNTEDGETLYYTYIFKKKSHTVDCDATETDCPAYKCMPNEDGCEQVVCSDEILSREFVPVSAECSIFVPAPKVEEPIVEEPKPTEPEAITPTEMAPSSEDASTLSPVVTPPQTPSKPTSMPAMPPTYDPSTDTSL